MPDAPNTPQTRSRETNTRTASCSCGSVTLRVSGDPVRVSICHCFACQKRSGAPFAQQARFERDQVSVQGPTRQYERKADSGNLVHFHFCPNCATVMYYCLQLIPDHIAIPVGLLAEPDFPAPDFSVYEARMHHWVKLPDNMEHMN